LRARQENERENLLDGKESRCWNGRGAANEGISSDMRAEISYDLVMDDDMLFVEGAFRLEGSHWQVVIVSRCDVDEPQVVPQRWENGVTGVFIRYPRADRLNRTRVERLLSVVLGVSEWVEVRGPDSMQLR
jgi:hypothetical protein